MNYSRNRIPILFALSLGSAISLAGCDSNDQPSNPNNIGTTTGGSETVPTPTPSATPNPTATPSPAPSVSPTATPTPAPSATPIATPTPAPTATPDPNANNGSAACKKIALGTNGDLNGFVPFPADNPWNQDISGSPAASNSATLMSNYIAKAGNNYLQGDIGSQYGENWNVVDSATQSTQVINATMYPEESDVMQVPLPNNAVIEGSDGGDRHMFVLDRNNCWLYESWGTTFNGSRFSAANTAVWDLLNTSQRPYNWTSADAAGLPIFPGLVRYDEVARGEIKHAIRITLKSSADAYVAPATHSAGSDSNSFPMGTRFRLKASFDISKFSKNNQVILKAMKKYGVILADNGLDFQFAGAKDSRWVESEVVALRAVRFGDMEVITQGGAINKANPPKGPAPTINTLSSSVVSVSAGQPVTLTWNTANSSWNFIDAVGPVRGNSVIVYPKATTTYTLNSTNQYGRTKKSILIQVH